MVLQLSKEIGVEHMSPRTMRMAVEGEDRLLRCPLEELGKPAWKKEHLSRDKQGHEEFTREGGWVGGGSPTLGRYRQGGGMALRSRYTVAVGRDRG